MFEPRQGLLTPPDTFNFPHNPYDIQKQFMIKLYEIIELKKIGIFESPTGTGKSLSLICSAIKWLLDYQELYKKELTIECERLKCEINENGVVVGTTGATVSSTDWLSEQSETIKKRERLMELQKLADSIDKHDEEMLRLKKSVKDKIGKKNVSWKTKIKIKSERSQIKKFDDSSGAPGKTEQLGGAEPEEEDEEFLINDNDHQKIDDDNDDECLDINQEDDDNEKYNPVKIYFCSRTHSQLTQIVNEIKRTAYANQIRVISLASRQTYCINETVRKLQSNALINERCLELQKSNAKPTVADQKTGNTIKKAKIDMKKCEYYQSKVMQNDLKAICLNDVMDIEEIVTVARTEHVCPYYGTRAAAKEAQFILLPYQMLLHKKTRQQIGLNLKNAIIIIDEAHNLLDTLTNIHSCEITLAQLQSSHQQLLTYRNKYFTRFSTKNILRLNQLCFIVQRLIKMLTKQQGITENVEGKSTDDKSTTTTATTTDEHHRMILPYELKVEGEFFTIDLQDILKFCDESHLAQKCHGYIKRYGFCEINNEIKSKKVTTKSYLKELAEQKQEDVKKKSDKDGKKILLHENKKINLDNAVVDPLTVGKEFNDNDHNKGSVLRNLFTFLECLMDTSTDGRILIKYNFKGLKSKSSMKYILLNANEHFDEILNDCRSLIVAGGTMQPTTEFTEQLFINHSARIEQHFFGHVVDANAVLPIALHRGPGNKTFQFNYTNRTDKLMLTDLSMTLQNICNVIPSGIVCFFNSYDYMEMIYKFLLANGTIEKISIKKRVLKEPRNNTEIDGVLADYSKAAKKFGALLFSVVGGKLSEGLNFSDDLGRCVCVIGLPFPNRNNPELIEKMEYLDRKQSMKLMGPVSTKSASTEYYENLCMKSVNQCIGRAIRHINDYACVLLIDVRYQEERIIKKLPEWIGRSLKIPQSYGAVQGMLAKWFRDKKKV